MKSAHNLKRLVAAASSSVGFPERGVVARLSKQLGCPSCSPTSEPEPSPPGSARRHGGTFPELVERVEPRAKSLVPPTGSTETKSNPPRRRHSLPSLPLLHVSFSSSSAITAACGYCDLMHFMIISCARKSACSIQFTSTQLTVAWVLVRRGVDISLDACRASYC